MKATYNELLKENDILKNEISSLKNKLSGTDHQAGSVENFKSIFENSCSGIALVGLDGRYLKVNPAFCEIFGYSSKELLKIDFLKITHPDDIELSKNIFKKSLDGNGKKIKYSKRYIHKNGDIIWCEINSVLVYDNNKKPSHFITHVNNITNRKLAEDALLISKSQLTNAMKMAGLGYWEYDVVKDLFTFNDNFYSIFRITADQIGSYNMSSTEYASRFVYPEDRETIRTEMQRAIKSEDPDFNRQLDHRILFSNREIGYISSLIFLVKDEKGKTIKTFGVNQDITERKRAEEAIRKSEQKFAKAFNSVSVIMSISDMSTGELLEINDTFCQALGLKKEEILGKTVAQLGIFENELQRNVLINDVRKHGFARNIEMDVRNASGKILHGLFSAVALDFGKEIRLLTTMIDITERKRAEEALQYSEMHFRAMVENAGDAVTLVDAKGKIIYESPSVERITGFKTDDRKEKSSFENIYYEDMPIIQAIFNRILKNYGSQESAVFRSVRKDGTIWWTEATATNLLNKPSVRAVVVNYRDISERKRVEDALSKSRETLERITSSIDDTIYSIDAKTGEFEFLSPVFERKFGYSLSDINLMGGRWPFLMQIIKDQNTNQADPVLTDLKKNKVKKTPVWENWWQSKDGNLRYIEDRSVPIYEGNQLIRIDGVLRDITGRKKAEDNLKESEEKFSKAFHLMPVSMAISRLSDGKYLDLNEAYTRLTGHSRETTIGKSSLELKLWVDQSVRAKIRKDLQEDKKIQEIPVKFITKSGKILDILYSAVIIKLGDQQCLISLALDITERNRAEEALREERTLLRTIVDNLPISLYIKDKDGRKIITNPVDLKSIGKPESEVLGKTDKDLLPSEVAIKTMADDTSILTTGIPVVNKEEFIHNKFDKSQWILTTKIPRKNIAGENIGIIGMSLDITERKKAEEQIDSHNKRLESMFRISQFKADTSQQLLDYAMNEAIELTKSKIGIIHLYNEETRQLTLVSGSQNVLNGLNITHQSIVYDFNPPDQLNEVILKRSPIIENNYESNRKSKKVSTFGNVDVKNFLSIPIINNDKIIAIISLANKMTDYDTIDAQNLTVLTDSVWKMIEKQRYQEELIIAKEKAVESDKLKSAFLANMSHEIRTPMNAIIGFSEILLKPDLNVEKKNKYTVIVMNSCKKLLSIVDDILDISIIDSGQVEIKKVSTVINEIIFELFTIYDNVAKSSNISIYFHNTLDNISSTIFTDKIRLNQILNNLLNNAFKFTSKGQIDFGYELKDGFMVFYVRDTGIGIPKHLQNVIFERFRQAELELTREYGGTGLGLSISQKLVELLGGKLWVESEPDKGSTFYFTIPYDIGVVEKKQKVKKNVIEKHRLLNKEDFTILVAEDELNNFLYIEEVLNESGINILHAANGIEAVDLCNRNRNIRLILMDIKMPKMNGIEATKEIKKLRPDLRIIALTAFAMESEKRYVLKEGCDDYISKPVSPEYLQKIIKQYIRSDK